MTPVFASIAFCGLLLMLSFFQVALIAGAPLGHLAWGGQHRTLPRHMRIASLTSIVIYVVMSLLVLSKAGMIDTIPLNIATFGCGAVSLYCLLGIVTNAISRSKPERLTMVPVATMLFVASLAVTLA